MAGRQRMTASERADQRRVALANLEFLPTRDGEAWDKRAVEAELRHAVVVNAAVARREGPRDVTTAELLPVVPERDDVADWEPEARAPRFDPATVDRAAKAATWLPLIGAERDRAVVLAVLCGAKMTKVSRADGRSREYLSRSVYWAAMEMIAGHLNQMWRAGTRVGQKI